METTQSHPHSQHTEQKTQTHNTTTTTTKIYNINSTTQRYTQHTPKKLILRWRNAFNEEV
eukprot:UN25177